MAFNVPILMATAIYVALADSPLPTELGSLERIISYIGLMAMGWFFWKRESGRTDKTVEELREENAVLKREIKELERDIRALLSNRIIQTKKKRHERFLNSEDTEETED